MTTQIVRKGNTLTVEIPEELATQAQLLPGEPVEWVPNGSGSIALVKKPNPPAMPKKRITLEELLEGIPEGAEMEKVDWGPDRGAEVW
jgi:antitoxin component of MazEF toxin-antitoxin module